MKRLISILLISVLLLCGCSNKEEIVKYDLAICDVSISEMCEYLNNFENENFEVIETEFSAEYLDAVINTLDTNSDGLNSITLYSKNITEETAQQFIAFAKSKQLPVTFAFSNINDETLTSYDKAFCIVTNYKHAGELAAEKIKTLWTENRIKDADGNMMFAFSVVRNDELSADMQTFYDTLIAGIELYGVPMQIGANIDPANISSGNDLVDLNKNNEALIVIDDTVLPFIKEYTPYSDGIEIISISEDYNKIFSDSSYVLDCFIDYSSYKLAADEIISNYNNRQYPLISSSFPCINRTVYISAIF